MIFCKKQEHKPTFKLKVVKRYSKTLVINNKNGRCNCCCTATVRPVAAQSWYCMSPALSWGILLKISAGMLSESIKCILPQTGHSMAASNCVGVPSWRTRVISPGMLTLKVAGQVVVSLILPLQRMIRGQLLQFSILMILTIVTSAHLRANKFELG